VFITTTSSVKAEIHSTGWLFSQPSEYIRFIREDGQTASEVKSTTSSLGTGGFIPLGLGGQGRGGGVRRVKQTAFSLICPCVSACGM
jgi:hypothetical protein